MRGPASAAQPHRRARLDGEPRRCVPQVARRHMKHARCLYCGLPSSGHERGAVRRAARLRRGRRPLAPLARQLQPVAGAWQLLDHEPGAPSGARATSECPNGFTPEPRLGLVDPHLALRTTRSTSMCDKYRAARRVFRGSSTPRAGFAAMVRSRAAASRMPARTPCARTTTVAYFSAAISPTHVCTLDGITCDTGIRPIAAPRARATRGVQRNPTRRLHPHRLPLQPRPCGTGQRGRRCGRGRCRRLRRRGLHRAPPAGRARPGRGGLDRPRPAGPPGPVGAGGRYGTDRADGTDGHGFADAKCGGDGRGAATYADVAEEDGGPGLAESPTSPAPTPNPTGDDKATTDEG